MILLAGHLEQEKKIDESGFFFQLDSAHYFHRLGQNIGLFSEKGIP